MKEFRFIHTADWHSDSDPVKQRKLEASLGQMVDYCQANKVNAIIISGDVWERKQSYADNSGVPLVITYLCHLSQLVDFIFIVKGNNSHDEPGSISLLHQIKPNIYAYEQPVVLGVSMFDNMPFDLLTTTMRSKDKIDYIVSLFPYPTKAALLKENSIDESNEDYIQIFESILRTIGNIHMQYDVPKIFGFHGNVQGTRLSSGQTLLSQDIIVSPFTLQLAMADYYALGHIHLEQEVFPHGYYSGSIYNKNWGETEQKSFNVVEFLDAPNAPIDAPMYVKKVPLTSARPMVTAEAEFDPEVGVIVKNYSEGTPFDNPLNAEVRIKLKIKENVRKLFTDVEVQNLKSIYGEDVQIDLDVVPVERESRSEQIMECKSYVDEVIEYAAVVGEEVPDSVKAKVEEIQLEAGL